MSEQIITKRCSKCKETKPATEFYKRHAARDSLDYYCKICRKKIDNTNKRKAYMRLYKQTEKYKTTVKRYNRSERRKILMMNYARKNPLRYIASQVIRPAVYIGYLPHPKTQPCHYCPKPARQYHHHKGYAQEHWLDVVPVCTKCHSVKHPK